MELKDFMNSKGLGMEAEIHVTHRRDNGIHTIKIAEMLEEYHQAKLKLLGIADVVDSEERAELPASTIPEFGTDEWIDCCEQLFGGMRKSR